jgi:DNA polymerase I-like protein with 3'-5' exonuclease and polymerase domains
MKIEGGLYGVCLVYLRNEMLHALDFESEAIDDRPNFPPLPVGLAHYDGTDAIYLAWGHPIQNNCKVQDAINYAKEVIENEDNELVFHNAPFDCSIFEEKFNIKIPWERVHDTMLQAFLLDPYGELSLKPLADKYLGMPPTEQDMLEAWIVQAGYARAGSKTWGAHISKTPGNLCGRYACGDVIRTLHLYRIFKQKLAAKGMQ